MFVPAAAKLWALMFTAGGSRRGSAGLSPVEPLSCVLLLPVMNFTAVTRHWFSSLYNCDQNCELIRFMSDQRYWIKGLWIYSSDHHKLFPALWIQLWFFLLISKVVRDSSGEACWRWQHLSGLYLSGRGVAAIAWQPYQRSANTSRLFPVTEQEGERAVVSRVRFVCTRDEWKRVFSPRYSVFPQSDGCRKTGRKASAFPENAAHFLLESKI